MPAMYSESSLPARGILRGLTPGRLFLLVLLLSLAVRLAFFAQYTYEGTDCDGAGYMNLAENVSRGAGWVNNSVRVLFFLPDSLPQPDAHWSPLYPLMTAVSFKLFGVSHTSAKLVPLLFGVLTPALIALLVLRLTGSIAGGLVGGVLAAFHPTLVTWSLRIETEIMSACLITLALWLVLARGIRGRVMLVGLALGLAYLAKYQNVLLWPGVLLFLALEGPWRVRARNLAVATGVALAVISPWLIRNAVVFGDPFFSLPRYFLIARYPDLGGPQKFVAQANTPPDGLAYMLAHLRETVAMERSWLRRLPGDFVHRFGGTVLLVPLVAFGLISVVRRWRVWIPSLVFAGLLVVASAPTEELRYVLVLVPIWLLLAAAGWAWIGSWRRLARFRAWPAVLTLFVLAAVVLEAQATVKLAGEKNADWTPAANYCALEAAAAAPFVESHTEPDEVVFACEPWHFTLACGRNAVSVPFDADQLRDLARRYGIRYLVIAVRDLERRLPEWVENPPAWAELVERIPPETIARPDRAPDYDRVSEIRIYRLEPESAEATP